MLLQQSAVAQKRELVESGVPLKHLFSQNLLCLSVELFDFRRDAYPPRRLSVYLGSLHHQYNVGHSDERFWNLHRFGFQPVNGSFHGFSVHSAHAKVTSSHGLEKRVRFFTSDFAHDYVVGSLSNRSSEKVEERYGAGLLFISFEP